MSRSAVRALKSVGACLVALIVGIAPAAAQLSPPAGPVSPTMKRLDQVEPRACVNSLPGSATAVHVISEPGNYVLTGDVLGQDRKSGIEITCDGRVSLDLNGFSLLGVAGSLHGVHVREPGSGLPTGRRQFSLVQGPGQGGGISSWGGDGLNISSVDVCDVSGLSITDCGGAACRVGSHETAMASIRNIKAIACGGGGVWVDVTASSGAGGGAGKASFSDLTMFSCGGDALHIRCSSSSTCDVSVERCAASSCSGHGVCVDATHGAGGGGGGAGKVSFSDLSISSCTGDGVRCVCSPEWRASCSIDGCVVAHSGSDGVHVVGADVCSVGGLSCSDCVGTGLFVSSSSGADPSGALVLFLSKKGYDYYCARSQVGLHAERLQQVSLASPRCVSCVEEGIRCVEVSLCDISSCDVSLCGGDGVSVSRIGKFKAGSELSGRVNRSCSITACGGNGLSVADCPDASCVGLDVSLCLGDGIRCSWTQVSGPFRFSSKSGSLSLCGGNGISLDCPASSVDLEAEVTDCVMSSNTGAGLSISCPSASPVVCRIFSSSSSNNGSSGVELVCHPESSVQCVCSHLRCVHNGGAGMLCISSDPTSTLSSGSLHLDSSVFSSNSGEGCRCACPLVGDRCVFSENGSSGVDISVASPFDSAGSLSSSSLHRNALHGARCGPGRFAGIACDIADNGGDGMRCESGCLIADRCVSNRNGGDGLHVSGTLTVSGGAMRRNGGAGVRCAGGTCVMADCVCELNGANPGVTGGGALFVDCPSVSLHRCVCSNNTGPGVSSSSSSGVVCAFSAVDCTCASNSSSGLSLRHCAGSQVLRCVLSGNGEWGLECPQSFSSGKIEACSCIGNGGGILVQGQNNLVISNTCSSGPIGSLSVAQGNAVGRIVDQASLSSGACDSRSNLIH